MGRPIVYCDSCGKLLREEDFARGKAQEIDHRNFCSTCRPLPGPTSSTPRTPVPLPKKGSSGRVPASAAPRPSSKSSPAVPPAPPPSRGGLIIGAVAGVVVVLGIIVAVASSGSPNPAAVEEVKLRPAPRAAPTPVAAAVDDASRAPLLKALAFRRAHPNEIGGQIREFEEAIRALAGTRHEEDAKRELADLRRRIADELAEVGLQAAPFAGREEFGKALSLLEAARRRYDDPGWIQGVDAAISRIRAPLEAAMADVRAKAEEAKGRKSADELARLGARVARWEIPEERTLLSHLVLKEPDAPPPPPAPPPAPTRVEALAHAAARDYEAAIAALGDAKEETELLKLAQAAAREGALALLGSPRGKKLAVEYRDPTGGAAKIDDVLLRADATRLELKLGADSVVIPIGEVLARTLAEAYRAKGGDARAAAALRWLEGDVEGLDGLPERLKGSGAPATEAARRLFYDAEMLYFEPGRQDEARAAYQALLAEHAATAFARRNRAAIQARLEPPKDFVFLADELKAGGSFKLVPNRKVERCWSSEKDAEPRASNFVELSFFAAPERPLRAFALVGGCCAEVFTAAVSGTELKDETPLKHSITGLKRRHEDHLGPKEPDRWEWVTIPLPKYAEAGTKTLRILTDQKGFSVALVAVMERTTPPRDLDAKEVERRRGEVPGHLSRGGVRLGVLTHETWTGVGGGGIGDLRGAPGFPDKPSRRGLLREFSIPVETGDDYGTRVHGYLHPPASGDYVFWIATDDQGELWLSADDDPKNKVLIARVPEWVGPRDFGKYPEQQSKPVRLEAGRRYYVEALHKEGWGGDHLSVRWKLPDGTLEEPIPGSRLSAWTGPKR